MTIYALSIGLVVLQLLQDGFGFLRAMESNYLAGPNADFFSSMNKPA